MTGRYFPVPSLDLRGKVQFIRKRTPQERMLPEILNANGYHTAIFSAHRAYLHERCPLWDAFDEAQLAEQRRQETLLPTFGDINSDVLPWLEQAPQQPFFLYVHAVDTHMPHVLEHPFDRWLDPTYSTDHLEGVGIRQVVWRQDGRPFTPADKQFFQASHDGSLSYADHQIGLLLDKLAEEDLLHNTIIIIGSDHGDALGEDGRTVGHSRAGLSDEVLRVPLVIAGPGIPEGVRVDRLTENVDIVPTLIDLLGLDTIAAPHGKTLMPLMRNSKGPPVHDYVFAWSLGTAPGPRRLYDAKPAVMIRTTKYKYERDPTTNLEHLWRVPDSLLSRKDLSNFRPSVARKMRKLVDADRLNLRSQYLGLPFTDIVLEALYLGQSARSPEDFVIGGDETSLILQEDNKWTVNKFYFWSAAWSEDAPAVDVSVSVPNGRYLVQIKVLVDDDLNGKPASSIRVKVEGDEEFRTVTVDSHPSAEKGFVTVPLGEYEISDGTFDATFDEGLDSHWAFLNRFHLVNLDEISQLDTTGEAVTLEQLKEREELLRALGYLE